MAVTRQFTRVTGAESESDSGTWDKLDKTTSPTQEVDFIYQGNNSISNKVGTSADGVDFDATTAVDVSTTPRTFIFKIIASNSSALTYSGTVNTILVRIGSAPGDYYVYRIAGSTAPFTRYPISGGWLIVPIDANVVAHRMSLTGTAPTLTAIDYFGFASVFGTTAKTDNFAIDAIDYVNNGEGLLWDGSGGEFQDFIDSDNSTSNATNGRSGIITTKEGIMYVVGTLNIGSATATTFTDSGVVAVFPEGYFDAGFSGLSLDLQSASTSITISDSVFKGRGKAGVKIFFDTISDVDDTANERIEIGGGLGNTYEVLYSNEGGSDSIGLTNNTAYYTVDQLTTQISLCSSRSNATSVTKVNLTDGTNGEEHSLLIRPDTRPDLTVSGTSGSASLTGNTFDTFRNITLTSGATLTNCIILNTSTVTQASGTLTGCRLSAQTTNPGESLVVSNAALDNISNCDFTAPTLTKSVGGHAIEYTGTPTATFTFTGNSFTGYGPDRAQFLTDATGIDTVGDDITTSTHGFSTGDPVYYNDEGGVASIGLTDGNKYYLNVISTTNVSVHSTESDAVADTNRIALSTSGAETHSFYSANAAIFNNNTSGTLTLNLAGGASAPSVRNATGATTVIPANTVTTTIRVRDNTGANLENARVLVRAASGGPEPHDTTVTISRSGTVATVSHTGHGLSVNDKVQIKGITDKTEDNKIQTIVTVPDNNSYTYTTTNSGSTSYTGTILVTAVFIDGLTNASGEIADTRSFASNQPVDGFVRKSSASPRFKTFNLAGNTIDSTDGLTVTLRMILDE